jgi:hypothetical protein
MAGNAIDVITRIKQEADALVRRVNPDCDYTGPWFAPKVAEVAETITRRLYLNLTDQARPDLARLIRIAWERSA